MTPNVSVIIVNYNGKKWLKPCLDSLSKQIYKNFEIIVVDNNSNDGSVAYLNKNYPKVIMLQSKTNVGFSEGNNNGYKLAKGQYIILLNNDTIVENNFIKNLLEAYEKNPHAAIIQPKIVHMQQPESIDTCGSYWTDTSFLYHVGNDKHASLYNESCEVFSIKAAAAIIKTSVIKKIGLFDNDFWCYYEETDFCHRGWLSGYSTLYIPTTTVYHAGGGTSLSFGNDYIQFHNFKNKMLSFLKNFSFTSLFTILPLYLFFNFILSIYWLFQRKYKHSLSLYRAIWWNIVVLPKTLKKRKLVQSLRKISDQEYLKKVKKNPGLFYYYCLLTMQFNQYIDI